MVTTHFYSGIAGSSRKWLWPSVPSLPENKFIFFLTHWLTRKQHYSRFSQMLYLQQLDNYCKFLSNFGQRPSLLSSFQLEWSKRWDHLWVHFDSDLFSVISTERGLTERSCLLILPWSKNRQATMSGLILPSIVCHWTTKHPWIIHNTEYQQMSR